MIPDLEQVCIGCELMGLGKASNSVETTDETL